MRQHFEMTSRFAEEPFQMPSSIRSSRIPGEITLVTQDRPRLFAGMAAAWPRGG
jgi:[protein-PII] uridylyltransferase